VVPSPLELAGMCRPRPETSQQRAEHGSEAVGKQIGEEEEEEPKGREMAASAVENWVKEEAD